LINENQLNFIIIEVTINIILTIYQIKNKLTTYITNSAFKKFKINWKS